MVGLLHLQLFHQHGRKEERGIELRSDKPCLSIQDSTGSQHHFSGGCGLEITQSRGLGWVHFLYQFKDRQGKSEASQVASDGSHALQTELAVEGRRLSGAGPCTWKPTVKTLHEAEERKSKSLSFLETWGSEKFPSPT